MSNKFTEDYYIKYQHANPVRKFLSRKMARYPKQLFQLMDSVRNGSVLDIGCGVGGLLERIRNTGRSYNYFGIDIGQFTDLPDFINFARADGQHLPFRDESFDMVLLSHVIEHLHDPYPMIMEAYRILKPGGAIYLETPGPRIMYFPFGLSFYDDPTHVRPYTKKSLGKVLSDCGFTAVHSDVKRDTIITLFGLPYALFGRFLGDPEAFHIYATNILGCYVFATAIM